MHCSINLVIVNVIVSSSSFQLQVPAAAAASEMADAERLRVVSLLPAATDIVQCLGLSHLLVGRSHEVSARRGLVRFSGKNSSVAPKEVLCYYS